MLILCGAVTLWVGGFDVLYACQDVDYDQQAGLFSVPKRFGIANALLIGRAMHIGVVTLLSWLAFSFGLPGRLGQESPWLRRFLRTNIPSSRLTISASSTLRFFTVNGYISMLFLLFWGAAAAFWRV